jgi:8-oxo-dGTP pyrophosphatase MutT (NUDIX family)
MFNRRAMATAIVKKSGNFLLLKRSGRTKLYHGQWQFPEGGIKKGETPEQALLRELKEETGLHIKSTRKLGVRSSSIEYLHQKVWHFKRTFYSVMATGRIRLSTKHSKYGWFSEKELSKLSLMKSLNYDDFRRLLKKA